MSAIATAMVTKEVLENTPKGVQIAVIVMSGAMLVGTIVAVGFIPTIWGGDSVWKKIGDNFKANRKERKSGKLECWDSNYVETHKNELTITQTEANEIAKSIVSNTRFWNNANKLVANINLCKNWADWSLVCKYYIGNTGNDLYTTMTEELNNDEKIKVFDAVKKLKKV